MREPCGLGTTLCMHLLLSLMRSEHVWFRSYMELCGMGFLGLPLGSAELHLTCALCILGVLLTHLNCMLVSCGL